MMDKTKIVVEYPEAFFQTALKLARRLDRGGYSPMDVELAA